MLLINAFVVAVAAAEITRIYRHFIGADRVQVLEEDNQAVYWGPGNPTRWLALLLRWYNSWRFEGGPKWHVIAKPLGLCGMCSVVHVFNATFGAWVLASYTGPWWHLLIVWPLGAAIAVYYTTQQH